MGKINKRRKPRLDEERVKCIAATYEGEINGSEFDVVSVSRCITDAEEWQVLVRTSLPRYKNFDGLDKLIMVNDKTGKARDFAEYQEERLEKHRKNL